MPQSRASPHWSTLPRMGRLRQENHSLLVLSGDHHTRVHPAMVRLPAPLQHQGQRRRNWSSSAAGLRKRAVGAPPHPHPTADHITTLQAPNMCSELGGTKPFPQFLFTNEPTTDRSQAQTSTRAHEHNTVPTSETQNTPLRTQRPYQHNQYRGTGTPRTTRI